MRDLTEGQYSANVRTRDIDKLSAAGLPEGRPTAEWVVADDLREQTVSDR
jgi:hypothetical protein